MNIKEAKEQIENAITAYLSRDEYGNYEIPAERQRPIFLVGAPGIGKTAIMEQIAQEKGIGLVSYSMTHHTRQSALGLPYIRHRCYGGQEFDISEYTMSEIIASVYETIEGTGLKEGILFLDEINCVSETLAPSMLQFLQFKTFGRHRVPDGWVVVTAGNPPAYNRSVREFDVVTLDRLKKITVEPELSVWMEYAQARRLHPAVLTYLDIKKENFYRVESTADGKRFVTARGWEDLSQMLRLYEKHSLPVDKKLTDQYLQDEKISADFAAYYDLFHKYSADYAVEDILNGTAGEAILQRAQAARFDERYALLGLLLDKLKGELEQLRTEERALEILLGALKSIKCGIAAGEAAGVLLEQQTEQLHAKLRAGEQARTLAAQERYAVQAGMQLLGQQRTALAQSALQGMEAFQLLRGDLVRRLERHKQAAQTAKGRMTALFEFCEKAFADGQELLILVTELTVCPVSAWFIGRYGCEAYYAHNQELLFYERQKEIAEQLGELDLDLLE